MTEATARQRPSMKDLRPLVRLRKPVLSPTQRRLERALSISELRAIARRSVPRSVFDYVDGAAEDELSLQRARAVFSDLEFNPSVLRDVSHADLTCTPLGQLSDLPFSLAPTGFTRMMHHAGEPAVARAAARRGVPYALSTVGTTSAEDLRAAAPKARLWFQLYVWRHRDEAAELVARAAQAGYEALILTVDVPVAGARRRDAHNGLTIPPNLTPRTLAGMAIHPKWWFNLLSTEPLKFGSLDRWDGTVAELIDQMFDPTMTLDDLEWIRSIWPGPLVVKGVQSVADARRVAAAGADAVVLSNHGGRQLDRAPVPLRLVPDTVDAVGATTEVWVDTGVMSGADVIAGHALGASNVLVGRAYLYGLMAGGERGVDRALEILASEASRCMKLLGVSSLRELTPAHVRLG
jgi:L-lactate dehydrogenase (cytochrome)